MEAPDRQMGSADFELFSGSFAQNQIYSSKTSQKFCKIRKFNTD